MKILKKTLKKIAFRLIRKNYPFQMEGLITCHNTQFLSDEGFLSGYQEAFKIDQGVNFDGNWHHEEQISAYLIYSTQFFARYCCSLKGDFVECGTWKGRHAISILKYLKYYEIQLPGMFYLFDTFQGLSSEISPECEIVTNNKAYNENVLKEVTARFLPFENVKIVPGVLPWTLDKVEINRISFLHIDLNTAIVEQKCLEVLFDRVVKGGIIIFDDYGQTGHSNQKDVIDKYLLSKGEIAWTSPTRQGIVIKSK